MQLNKDIRAVEKVLEDRNYIPKKGTEKITDIKAIENKITQLESNISEIYQTMAF